MIVNNSLDEVNKREASYKTIKNIINQDDYYLYDLTGLSGGFLADINDLDLLQTYIGPSVFEEEIQKYGKAHMGGEKILAVNRTSSGILASILALVKKNTNVLHFLKEFPGHPSISRACDLVNANYKEFININNFEIPDNTSLLVITGSTMDHKVLEEDTFKKLIDMAHEKNIPVLVDDASGARLRTVIFNQKKATDLGADLAITSTDKLMNGPRGGLIAGKKDLINKIQVKANQFGLEAQAPAILAMINGLKDFDGRNLLNSLSKKEELLNLLGSSYGMFKESPTGVMVQKDDLFREVSKKGEINLSPEDICFLWSKILLKKEHIITIPAVSMPGASTTVRFDLSSKDMDNLEVKSLFNKINSSFEYLLSVVNNLDKVKSIIYLQ